MKTASLRALLIIVGALATSASALSAQQYMYATVNVCNSIIKINTSTGSATTIGPSLAGGATFAGAFTSDGSFWTLTNSYSNSALANSRSRSCQNALSW